MIVTTVFYYNHCYLSNKYIELLTVLHLTITNIIYDKRAT